MQKVEGSSPFIRSSKAPPRRGFRVLGPPGLPTDPLRVPRGLPLAPADSRPRAGRPRPRTGQCKCVCVSVVDPAGARGVSPQCAEVASASAGRKAYHRPDGSRGRGPGALCQCGDAGGGSVPASIGSRIALTSCRCLSGDLYAELAEYAADRDQHEFAAQLERRRPSRPGALSPSWHARCWAGICSRPEPTISEQAVFRKLCDERPDESGVRITLGHARSDAGLQAAAPECVRRRARRRQTAWLPKGHRSRPDRALG